MLLVLTFLATPVAAHGVLGASGGGKFINVGPNGSLGHIPLSALGDKVTFGFSVHLSSATIGVTAPVLGGSGVVRDHTQGWTAYLNPVCGAVPGPSEGHAVSDIGHVNFWGTARVKGTAFAEADWLWFAASHDKDAAVPNTVGLFDRFLLVLIRLGLVHQPFHYCAPQDFHLCGRP